MSPLRFALAFAFFGTPLLLGSSLLALMVYDSIEISNCAHAGAMYAMMSSTFAGDTTGIQNAAQADASDFGSNVNVNSSNLLRLFECDRWYAVFHPRVQPRSPVGPTRATTTCNSSMWLPL